MSQCSNGVQQRYHPGVRDTGEKQELGEEKADLVTGEQRPSQHLMFTKRETKDFNFAFLIFPRKVNKIRSRGIDEG